MLKGGGGGGGLKKFKNPWSSQTGSNRWQPDSKTEKVTSLSSGRGYLVNKQANCNLFIKTRYTLRPCYFSRGLNNIVSWWKMQVMEWCNASENLMMKILNLKFLDL